MAEHGDEAELVAAAVAGRPLAEIAAAAGVSVSTVQRRLRDREIQRAVQEGRAEARRVTVARMLELRDAAMARLGELLFAEKPEVALRAAGLIVSSSFKAETAYDFHDRLAALEAVLDDPDAAHLDDASADGGYPGGQEPEAATGDELGVDGGTA